MRTRAFIGRGLHRSGTRGCGRCLDLKEGLPFPLHHCYLRGLDDLVLKEGGVVKSTFAIARIERVSLLGEWPRRSHWLLFRVGMQGLICC
jgi:hypothetical protein